MKNPVPQLTDQYLRMLSKLREGYPTQMEKLNELFFTQDIPEAKIVITKRFEREENTGNPRKTQKRIGSPRKFSGRVDIKVVYPKSGNIYDARIKSLKDLCAIEPIEPDTAYWIVERRHLEGVDVVDLNCVPHIRQYHNKSGREFLSDFR